MIYRTFGIFSAASLMVLSSGCARLCQHADQEITQPVLRTEAFLKTYPNPKQIFDQCPTLLQDLKSLPAGTDTIRKMADANFSESAHCNDMVTTPGFEYTCTSTAMDFPAVPGSYPVFGSYGNRYCGFVPTSYEYCDSYNFDNSGGVPTYTVAINLSRDIDVLYAKVQKMCTDATKGDRSNAVMDSADALQFADTTVLPEGKTVTDNACN